jgi:raffinose/stachyose/melibiose transport system substrate-binding protein
MKKTIKKVSIFCLALSMILSIAGCSNSSLSSKPSSKPSSSTASTSDVTLNLWGTVPTTAQWAQLYPEWQKEYPNIKINYWFGESSDYDQKLQVAMAGGAGPDVLWLQPALIQKYQNLLAPLNDYATKDLGSDWTSQLTSTKYLSEIEVNGKLYAMPTLIAGGEIVLYNKTLFDKCGITKTPTTLAEWISDAKILKANGLIPVATGLKDSWMDQDVFLALNSQVAPGSVYDAINGKLSWTDSKIKNTMDTWKTLYDSGLFENGSLGISTYPDARDQYYYSTKAAMFLTGSWHLAYALPVTGEKFLNGVTIGKDVTGAFMMPQVGSNPTQAFASVDSAFGVSNSSKYKDAAWDFVKFMYNGKGQQYMVNTLQGFTALKNTSISDDTMNKLAPTDKDAVLMTMKAFENPIGIRAIPYSSITDALSVAMQNVASGQETSEQALQAVQQASASVSR